MCVLLVYREVEVRVRDSDTQRSDHYRLLTHFDMIKGFPITYPCQ